MRPHVIVPTRRNVRFHQFLAALVLAFGVVSLMIVSYTVVHGGAGRLTPWSAVLSLVPTLAGVMMLRGLASTLAHQYDRLRTRSKAYPVERVAVEPMRRGKLTHFHVVVAHFRTDQGALQEALSETFDYDPGPLLDVRRIEVIADPYEPALCLVSGDTLPPRALRWLSNAQRRELGTLSRAHHALLIVGSLVAVAMFLYGAVELVRLRF
jgi:hypothetical protein